MRLFPQGALVFEIGACTGDAVKAFLQHGAGRVVAVEPQCEDVDYLLARFAGDERVIIVPEAVGSARGMGHLAVCTGARSCSTLVSEIAWGPGTQFSRLMPTEYQPVKITTLDKLIETYGMPHFVNMTIVRYEYQALLGLTCPLPWIAFAVTNDTIRMGWAEQAVDRIVEIAPGTKFNYTDRSSLIHNQCAPLRWHKWHGADIIKKILPEVNTLGLWGRIHARMI